MARGRMISKSLSTSKRFAQLFQVVPDLAEFAQSLYPLLVSHTDDFGRQAGDLFTIKHRVHPASPRSAEDFERALKAMHAVGLIVWYSDGREGECIQVVQFEKHQVGLHKRTRSEFPKPPHDSGKFPEGPPQVPGNSNPTELNRTEQKEEQDQDPRAGARRSLAEVMTAGRVRSQLRAAAHAELDADPDISEGELVERVKQTAADLNVVDYAGEADKVIRAVRGERARRHA